MSTHKIDRKTASKLLKVSIRTVDRYIVAKKLSTENRDGRIWLEKSEIKLLQDRKNSRQNMDTVMPDMSIDSVVSTPVDMSMDSVHSVSTLEQKKRKDPGCSSSGQEQVYKKLFEEQRQELKQKQERLEGANYRVGQLEALLKDTVPLLDYQRALNEKDTSQNELYKTLEGEKAQGEQLKLKIKEEKFDKKIYLILLFVLLLLQPLWLILTLK
jgi:hypothetical protein